MASHRSHILISVAATLAVGGCAASPQDPVDRGQDFVDQNGVAWTFVGPTRATGAHATPSDLEATKGVPADPPREDDGRILPRTGVSVADNGHGLEYVAAKPSPERLAQIRARYAERFPEPPTEPNRVLAKVIGDDGRVSRSQSSTPYKRIAQYVIPLAGNLVQICTATLIGDRYASTAAHCVYDRGDNAWIYGNTSDATLDSLGLGKDRGWVCVNGDCEWVDGRWRPEEYATTTFIEREHDYALLRLQGDLGTRQGTFGLSSITDQGTLRDLQHYNAGYPGEVDGNAVSGQWGMSCDVDGTSSDGRLNHSCDTSDGNSGGPVYYLNSSGTYYMTGIHSGYNLGGNTGPLVGEVRDFFLDKM